MRRRRHRARSNTQRKRRVRSAGTLIGGEARPPPRDDGCRSRTASRTRHGPPGRGHGVPGSPRADPAAATESRARRGTGHRVPGSPRADPAAATESQARRGTGHRVPGSPRADPAAATESQARRGTGHGVPGSPRAARSRPRSPGLAVVPATKSRTHHGPPGRGHGVPGSPWYRPWSPRLATGRPAAATESRARRGTGGWRRAGTVETDRRRLLSFGDWRRTQAPAGAERPTIAK